MTIQSLLSFALLIHPSGGWREGVAHRLHLKKVPPVTARMKPVGVTPTSTPRASGSKTAISWDPYKYRIDEKGQFVRDYSEDRVDTEAIKSILGPVEKAIQAGDCTLAERELSGIPGKARNLELDATTLSILRASYYQNGALIADLKGDYRQAAEWAYAYLQKSQNEQVEVVFAIAVARLGDKSPEVTEFLSERVDGLFPSLSSATANGGWVTDEAVTELIATRAFAYGASEIHAVVHAERALALAPKQAYSAIILIPIYSRQRRFQDAVRVGEAAMLYASGDALDILNSELPYPRAMVKALAAPKPSARP